MDTPEKNNQKQEHKEIIPVLTFCIIIFALGLLTALIHSGTNWTSSMIALAWIMACSITGTFFGFLFGIPKIVQPDKNADSTSQRNTNTGVEADSPFEYKQQINNNLIEISDWLTKIIVGLGLVNLTKVPGYMERLATVFAKGLGDGAIASNSEMAFAYGIITCFFVTGFIFGYLSTRLYLAGAFSSADQNALRIFKNLLSTTSAKVESLEANQDILNQTLYPENPAAQQQIASGISPIEELKRQANEYLNILISDPYERVRQKNLAASRMSSFALSNNISKDQIVQLLNQDKNEGLVITLANLIINNPEKMDWDRLKDVVNNLDRKHARHRVLGAIGKLVTEKLLPISEKPKIFELMKEYGKGADRSLKEKISTVTTLLNNYSG